LPRIKHGVNSGGYPERIEKTGFLFSRLRAEALRRASTGMTKKGRLRYLWTNSR